MPSNPVGVSSKMGFFADFHYISLISPEEITYLKSETVKMLYVVKREYHRSCIGRGGGGGGAAPVLGR